MLSSIADLHPPVDWPNADKLAHVSEYSLLGFLLARALDGTAVLKSRFGCMLFAILLALATGLLDELWQVHVPGRQSSPYDFLADATGALIGQVLYALWRRARGFEGRDRQRY